ncbi:MAG: hypothetical protein WA384_04565, partial [Rhodomicrobium sp.]
DFRFRLNRRWHCDQDGPAAITILTARALSANSLTPAQAPALRLAAAPWPKSASGALRRRMRFL